MNVKLLHYTPLQVCSTAIRTCWDSFDNSDQKNECGQIGCSRYRNRHDDINCMDCEFSDIQIGEKDKELIERVGNKFKHSSTLEHLTYNFFIEGVSRALLQELARHRIASLSVKSTRYTLKELKGEDTFIKREGDLEVLDRNRVLKYLVFTDDPITDNMSIRALENLRIVLKKGISNDIAKYCLPEAYKTSLTWTINARSLQNFLSLRSDRSALWEIRWLAQEVFNALPNDHKYLFEPYFKRLKIEE